MPSLTVLPVTILAVRPACAIAQPLLLALHFSRSGNDSIFFGLSMTVVLLMVLCSAVVYFVPTIVARVRHVDRMVGIVALNILLGWTFFGWIGALLWACSAETEAQAALRNMAYRQMAASAVAPHSIQRQ